MRLAHLLREDLMVLDLQARDSSGVMLELVEFLSEKGVLINGLKAKALEALEERESQISTGVGCGVGLPHAYLDELEEPVAVFGRSTDGIEFCSCDHAPVHFVVMLLIPASKRAQHLATLADVGKSFLNCEVRRELAEVESSRQVIEVLGR